MFNLIKSLISPINSLLDNTDMIYFKFIGEVEKEGGIVENEYGEGVKFNGIYITDKEKGIMLENGTYLSKYDAHILTYDTNISTLFDKDTSSNDYITYNGYKWNITGITDHSKDNGWIRIYITRDSKC